MHFRIEMDEYEHVTCMKNVWLKSGSQSSVRHNYVVLGTCNIMGEELSSRGRVKKVLLFKFLIWHCEKTTEAPDKCEREVTATCEMEVSH